MADSGSLTPPVCKLNKNTRGCTFHNIALHPTEGTLANCRRSCCCGVARSSRQSPGMQMLRVSRQLQAAACPCQGERRWQKVANVLGRLPYFGRDVPRHILLMWRGLLAVAFWCCIVSLLWRSSSLRDQKYFCFFRLKRRSKEHGLREPTFFAKELCQMSTQAVCSRAFVEGEATDTKSRLTSQAAAEPQREPTEVPGDYPRSLGYADFRRPAMCSSPLAAWTSI